MDELLAQAERIFDVDRSEILSDRRTRHVVRARQALAYVLYQRYRDLSLTEIGIRLGGRDHTTIIYSIRVVEQQMQTDPHFAAQVKELLATPIATRVAIPEPCLAPSSEPLSWPLQLSLTCWGVQQPCVA